MAMNFGGAFNPNQRMMNQGTAMAGGTGPVRVKKAPNLIQSLTGMVIGVVLVFGSPIAMWYAQSQHSAKDFKTAAQVEATSNETGYITFRAAPAYAEPTGGAACYVAQCAYEAVSHELLVTKTEVMCSNSIQESETLRVIRPNGSECDEETGKCTPCFDVEKDSWEEQAREVLTYDLKVGSYIVKPVDGATYFDTQEKIVDTGLNTSGKKTRNVYETFILPSTLLVAGDAANGVVTKGGKPYVFSQYDHETTYGKLKSQDQAKAVVLMIVTFLMLFVGISMILGPLQWFGRQFRAIPVIGPLVADGSKAIVGLISLLIAVPLWILLFVIVTVLKFWWLAIIILLLIGGGVYWYMQKKASPSTVPQA